MKITIIQAKTINNDLDNYILHTNVTKCRIINMFYQNNKLHFIYRIAIISTIVKDLHNNNLKILFVYFI
jgi:hypothetical protein